MQDDHAVRQPDKPRWCAVEAPYKDVLSPAQTKEFLKAAEDVIVMVAKHGTRLDARTAATCRSVPPTLLSYPYLPPPPFYLLPSGRRHTTPSHVT